MDLDKVAHIKVNLRDLEDVLERLKNDPIKVGGLCPLERHEAQKNLYRAQHEIKLAIHQLTSIEVQCEDNKFDW